MTALFKEDKLLNVGMKGGYTPLSLGATRGHESFVRLLLSIVGVNVNPKDNNYGSTPLSWAAVRGHEGVARLLLSTAGVDVNCRDDYRRTELPWKAHRRNRAMHRLLKEYTVAEPHDVYWLTG